MILFLVVVLGAGPPPVVENKCPPTFTVTNRCPAAKPARVTNGFNCGAGFCGANGGAGCPSCPNGNGTCACGPKAAAVAAPPVPYTLPASNATCPGPNCPQTQGYYRKGVFGFR